MSAISDQELAEMLRASIPAPPSVTWAADASARGTRLIRRRRALQGTGGLLLILTVGVTVGLQPGDHGSDRLAERPHPQMIDHCIQGTSVGTPIIPPGRMAQGSPALALQDAIRHSSDAAGPLRPTDPAATSIDLTPSESAAPQDGGIVLPPDGWDAGAVVKSGAVLFTHRRADGQVDFHVSIEPHLKGWFVGEVSSCE